MGYMLLIKSTFPSTLINSESVSPPITVILQAKLFSILGIFLYTSSYINNLLRSKTVAPIAMGLFKTVCAFVYCMIDNSSPKKILFTNVGLLAPYECAYG